jgi:bacteriocin biosynthesis cyclodehydratase domain-containing protein
MVLKLDPVWPIVWRDPQTVQFGVDRPAAVLERVTPAQERMIAALVAGVGRSGLDLFAGNAEVDDLLSRLGGALVREPAERAGAAVHGTGPTVERLGLVLPPAPSPVGIVAHHVVSPELHGRWLRRDMPHLPVVYGDSIVRIGPFVEPGSGPCLFCLELHRTDADPAWPAIASQLIGRRVHTETHLAATEVAAIVARMVQRRAADGPGPARSIELEVSTGRTSERDWVRHPDCQCGGIASAIAVRQGNANVSAPSPAPIRISPRRGVAAAEPA